MLVDKSKRDVKLTKKTIEVLNKYKSKKYVESALVSSSEVYHLKNLVSMGMCKSRYRDTWNRRGLIFFSFTEKI